jgi:hypothetical protein
MAGKNSPDVACGQILFSLKMSKLNYVVNETPYSAYITIRKRFIKDNYESSDANVYVTNHSDKDAELKELKDENKDLKTQLALAKVEFEEKEISKEKLLGKISKNEDEIEDFLEKERNFNTEKEDIS